jgi:hypothetical protein
MNPVIENAVAVGSMIGVCFFVGAIFIFALRLSERLVLVPRIGFVFSFVFFAIPIILHTAVVGGAVLMVVLAVFNGKGELTTEMRLAAGLLGFGLLLCLLEDTWSDLLERRKQPRS